MNKLFTFLLMFLFIINFTSALTCWDTVQKDSNVSLIQKCPSCTYVNITSINYPNGTVFLNDGMTANSNGVDFNYTLQDSTQLGTITYTTLGDKDGREQIEDLCLEITLDGSEGMNESQSIIVFSGIFLLMLVATVLGLVGFRFKNGAVSLALVSLSVLLFVFAVGMVANIFELSLGTFSGIINNYSTIYVLSIILVGIGGFLLVVWLINFVLQLWWKNRGITDKAFN